MEFAGHMTRTAIPHLRAAVSDYLLPLFRSLVRTHARW